MADPQALFADRYIRNPKLRDIFVRDLLGTVPNPGGLSESLAEARNRYARFDYLGTLEVLDWILLSETPAIVADSTTRSLKGAPLQRALAYREALILFEKVTSWIGFTGLIDSGSRNRGVEILNDVDALTSMIADDHSTASARAFRLRAAGAPAAAADLLGPAIAQSSSSRQLAALHDAYGALAFYLEDYSVAATAYARALDLAGGEMSSESLALAEGFRAIAEFRSSAPSERNIGTALTALDACEAEGHLGFAGQLRTRLAQAHFGLGDPDAALQFIKVYPKRASRISGAKVPKTEYRRAFLEAAASSNPAKRGLDELRSHLPGINAALSEENPFGKASAAFLRALLDHDGVTGAALLGPIVEYAVAQIARNTMPSNQAGAHGWTPLAKSITDLYERGLISYPDAALLTRVRVALRNPFSHGDLDALSLREYHDPLELFCVFSHICTLWYASLPVVKGGIHHGVAAP